MKFKDVQETYNKYKYLKNELKWSIKEYIKDNRLKYIYVRIVVDNEKVRVILSDELSVNEINGLQNKFGMILSMKETKKVNNISEDNVIYVEGESKRVIYTFRNRS